MAHLNWSDLAPEDMGRLAVYHADFYSDNVDLVALTPAGVYVERIMDGAKFHVRAGEGGELRLEWLEYEE